MCGENEALCAQCGPCADGSDLGVGQGCDSERPSGEPGVIIECTTASGCVETRSCNAGAECVTGYETGLVSCTDELDCGTLGCTGFPVCGEPESVCGPCGCCDVSSRSPGDGCSFMLGGEGESRYLFDDLARCYNVVPCAANEICAFDGYDLPICVSF